MSSWGVDLWDQRDIIEKHTHNGIDFLDKCASFVKERIRLEQDYAKSLRRLVKQYQFKKKEEEDLPYTYQHAFKKFLQESDDFAGQREVIAEETQNKILREMQKLSMESKTERKKAIQTLNEYKNHLEQLHKALQIAKKKYDTASDDAHTALKAYETASASLDLTKAQIIKFQKISQEKGHLADKAKEDYTMALDNYNKTQTLYYDADYPDTVNKQLQKPEENRIVRLSGFFSELAGIQQRVQPIISKCFDGMVEAGNSCDPSKDSLALIDRHKTGETPPGNLGFEEWGKAAGSATNLAVPSPISKKTAKSNKSMFGMSSKKKEQLNNENIANDHADLPPAQRRKKFNKTINALEDNIQQLEKSKAGMLKIAETSKQFGGDMASIQGQIDANEKEQQRIKALLHQYKCYLSAMDDDPRGSVKRPSTVDPPPPVAKPQSLEAPQSPEFGADEFDDEARCTVLYDFSGNNEGEMSVYAGEELVIVEEDDGSGWTRVLRGDEEGYIPTSYVERI